MNQPSVRVAEAFAESCGKYPDCARRNPASAPLLLASAAFNEG